MRFIDRSGQPAFGLRRVGVGDPEQMHPDGYEGVIELKVSGSETRFPKLKAGKDYALFALFDVGSEVR